MPMLIEINWKPDRKQLRTFGLVMLVCFAVIGLLLAWRFHSVTVLYVCLGIGCVFVIGGFLVPPLGRALYLFWMGIGFVVGSIVMPILIGIIYYLVLTPIGLVLRWRGRDSMRRRRATPGESYWVEFPHRTEPKSYERQF